MRFFHDSSVRVKMTLVTLAICVVVLLAATGALFSFQLVNFRQNFARDLGILADVVAENSIAPLAFKDEKAAREALAALKAKPQVLSAWIQLPDGTIFARYGEPAAPARTASMPLSGARFDGYTLLQARPIVFERETLGTLCIRADYQQAHRELLWLHLGVLGSVLAGSFALAFFLSSRWHRFISQPIQHLAAAARQVAENKDYSIRASRCSNDELGLFTDTFNQMLRQIQAQDGELQRTHQDLARQVEALRHEIAEREQAQAKLGELHKQLLEISRQAGMAEVATGVLHNVGNVLNSVNVSVSLIQERVRASKAMNLTRVVDMIEARQDNLGVFLTADEKGRMVPKYLRQLSERLATEHRQAVEVIEDVAKNVAHIKEIVAMQQSYAKVAGVMETLAPSALVEDALQINASALERHNIVVEREFLNVPPITVDRHKTLQILINLIRNAKYALDEGAPARKVLRLGIARHGTDTVRLTVKDNGVGILAENLTRIFSHGFTTRRDGHGFGLHSGALAAKEMGGKLSGHSDGPGLGATFTLELPIGGPRQNL
jgi:C4-dicarboxylate-specific signal transduction histidine kinase